MPCGKVCGVDRDVSVGFYHAARGDADGTRHIEIHITLEIDVAAQLQGVEPALPEGIHGDASESDGGVPVFIERGGAGGLGVQVRGDGAVLPDD